jgi:hypothetical protein
MRFEKQEPWKIVAGSMMIIPCPTFCLSGDRNGETHIRWPFLSFRDSDSTPDLLEFCSSRSGGV